MKQETFAERLAHSFFSAQDHALDALKFILSSQIG